MSEPFDVIRAFHDAFRLDMSQIDDSVLTAARSGGDMTPSLDRLRVMGEILDFHARAEEFAVFPAVDDVAPLVAKAYLMDHRELDNMVNGLEAMRKTTFDPLTTARATAVLRSHLMIHLYKEDAHLYPTLKNEQHRTNEPPSSAQWQNQFRQTSSPRSSNGYSPDLTSKTK